MALCISVTIRWPDRPSVRGRIAALKRSRLGEIEQVAHRMMYAGEIDGWLALSTILKARMELAPVLRVLPGGSPRA